MRYPWAVPGRKVVCVNMSNSPGRFWDTLVLPSEGEIYTIVSVIPSLYDTDGVNLKICGYPNIVHGSDVGYAAYRFRPLHTVETDVALFAGLLTPAPNTPMLPTNTNLEPTP